MGYFSDSAAFMLLGTSVVTLLALMSRFIGTKHLAGEPVYIPPSIPYFGHAIGLLYNKIPYYGMMSKKYGLPIFTLPMPAGKVYAVVSPDLVREVQRHPKSLSFPWVEAIFGTRLAGLSDKGRKLLLSNVQGENGEHGMFVDGLKSLIKILKPGPALDELNATMLKSVSNTLNGVHEKEHDVEMDLWAWVKHLMILATTDATYGPQNPYQNPVLEEAIWHVSDNVSGLLMNFFPQIFARKVFQSREILIQAFETYYKSGGASEASVMTKERYEATRDQLSLNDIARLDVVQGITILSNTVPAGFWTLYRIFSNPSVLSLVRDEATKYLQVNDTQAVVIRTLDVDQLSKSLVLKSILKEALRHHALGSGTRMVVEDVMIGGGHLLQKNCFVMLPNEPLQFNDEVWGTDVRDFNPLRFTKTQGSSQELAFRAFGGGANLCPGRFLATCEILSIVAMCALRFDMEPVNNDWTETRPDFSVMTSIVTPPAGKIMVKVRPREGFETGSWNFKSQGLHDATM